jgi:hypothetical protein
MPTRETTYHVRVSPPPSSLRTELNIVAAVVAVGICLVILALLANTPAPRAAHHPRAHVLDHSSIRVNPSSRATDASA